MITVRKTFVDYKPPISEDYIWIDVSGAEPIQKIFLNGEWRPLKDSDAEAEFNTGEKVSELDIQKMGSSSSANAKLTTKGYVDNSIIDAVKVKSDLATYRTIGPEQGSVAIAHNTQLPFNWVITQPPDEIDLTVDDFTEEAGVDTTDYITTIRFTSNSDSTYPTTLTYTEGDILWVNDELTIETDTIYLITLWKRIGILTKIAPAPSNS